MFFAEQRTPRIDESISSMSKASRSIRDLYLWPCIAAVAGVVAFAQAAIALRHSSQVMPATSPVPAYPVFSSASDDIVAQARALRTADPSLEAAVAPRRSTSELLVDAIIEVESGGDPLLVGGAGERGLMQIKLGTWNDMVVKATGKPVPFNRAFDPGLNRQVGKQYLTSLRAFLMERREDWKADERSLLLACYNAGPGRVMRGGFSLNQVPEQTRDYVRRVKALHDVFVRRAQAGDSEFARAPSAPAPTRAAGALRIDS